MAPPQVKRRMAAFVDNFPALPFLLARVCLPVWRIILERCKGFSRGRKESEGTWSAPATLTLAMLPRCVMAEVSVS